VRTSRRYWISVLVTLAGFCGANLLLLWRAYHIYDYGRPYGFPLPIYLQGGWLFHHHFRWYAIPPDLAALFVVAQMIFTTWNRLSPWAHR